MGFELWLVYLAASIGLSATPGPSGLLALTHGARHGLALASFTVLGGALGFFTLIAVSLAGLGALLVASEQAFTIAKWAGAAYLVWLGIRLWRAPVTSFGALATTATASGASRFRLFRDGFLVAVSNPKVIIFFAAFLPQFMTPGASWLSELLILGGTFVVVETGFELMLAGMAWRISPWLTRHGRWFNRLTGGAFIGVGALLATANR